ncbi:MAG: stage II sporulation protein D [Oscillospiraceae bacterium]|jgi:stage II sporulation protein D|nr:stage II sporulation protein D [Oscillospiraceae bacterium]
MIKQNLVLAAALVVMLLLLPVAALGLPEKEVTPNGGVESQAKGNSPGKAIAPPKEAALPDETIQVLRSASGALETVPMAEYLRGAVAAEMPAEYQEEALKAQAVACYTYARYKLQGLGKESVSDDSKTDQGYLSPTERKAFWGDQADRFEAKIGKAVDAVLGQTVLYEGKPIFAAFHDISGGQTEDASVYWGDAYPYLKSVASPGDRLSPNYSKTVSFTVKEMRSALGKADGVKLGDDPAAWFGKAKVSKAGTVTGVPVGGQTLTGREIRGLLELRSANFTVKYKDEAFEVKTLGHGHGVGMSQYGADFMARQGSSYDEILLHYYSRCEVSTQDSK